MSRILLLDLDHTLYPSTSPTLDAVDARITRFIETTLNLPEAAADQMRRDLCARYGTTLRGLEELHGVSREVYTTFIQDLGDHLMPAEDPRMRAWLTTAATHLPVYLFTNARRDWADRCLTHIGIADLMETHVRAILDIDFMNWIGKPDPSAYAKVEDYLAQRHPEHPERIFADDRLDNLEGARVRGWRTIWVKPHTVGGPAAGNSIEAAAVTALATASGHRVVDSLLELDPETLE